ncbi:MAG: secretin N-terminal domain-containing protein [Thermoanaerobaculia bacterium]
MKFKRVFLMISMLVSLCGAAFAEPATADGKPALAVHSFSFKFKQADKAAAAIKPLLSNEGSMSIQPSTNSLVVTDRAENMKAVAKMIGDFDKEPQSFRLYVRVVGASRVEGTPKIADDLKDVARKLAILPYNSYESVGEATVQGKEGDPGLIDMATGYRANFKFGEYDPASDSIAVNDLQIAKLTGEKRDQLTTLLKTSLNLAIGQTYVLGASKAPQSQRALMIVLVARR